MNQIKALVCVGLLLASGCTRPAYQDPAAKPTGFTSKPEYAARGYGQVSLRPDGKILLFTECSALVEPKMSCYVLALDLESKQLYRYDLDNEFGYLHAKYSPSGQNIVMTRYPQIDTLDPNGRMRIDEGQITMMRCDGSNFKVLTTSPGVVAFPAVSPDDARVSFAQGELRAPGSKSIAAGWEIWEHDLSTQKNQLFGGLFNFFTLSQVQYLNNDRLLINAYGPRSIWQQSQRAPKSVNINDEVFLLDRSASELSRPDLATTPSLGTPSYKSSAVANKNSIVYNAYFENAIPPKSGFFMVTPIANTIEILYPYRLSTSGIPSISIDNAGKKMAFVFEIEGGQRLDKALGLIDIATSRWSNLTVPPLEGATPISTLLQPALVLCSSAVKPHK